MQEKSPVIERYARIGYSKTAKEGWKYESTVSIKTDDSTVDIASELSALNRECRQEGEFECEVRNDIDAKKLEG